MAAPIIGATKPHHLADAVAALDLVLTDDEMHRLESPPHSQGALLVVTRASLPIQGG